MLFLIEGSTLLDVSMIENPRFLNIRLHESLILYVLKCLSTWAYYQFKIYANLRKFLFLNLENKVFYYFFFSTVNFVFS